jgi:hypothetical protein
MDVDVRPTRLESCPVNVISQAIVAPVADALTLAVNVPRADPTSPVGVGTLHGVHVVATVMAVAWPAPLAPATTARVRPRATRSALETAGILTGNPFCAPGSRTCFQGGTPITGLWSCGFETSGDRLRRTRRSRRTHVEPGIGRGVPLRRFDSRHERPAPEEDASNVRLVLETSPTAHDDRATPGLAASRQHVLAVPPDVTNETTLWL